MLAQNKIEGISKCYPSVDSALYHLLQVEYNLYKEKELLFIKNFLEMADKKAEIKNYPACRTVLDSYREKSLLKNDSLITLGEISPILIFLFDSNRQARASRAGSSLMNHISYLLSRCGFQEKKEYQREFPTENGCTLDFFFPDNRNLENDPRNCCSVACQTTSNDRFRLTFAQMPPNTRNRACTAIGHSNFGEKLGPSSLTTKKLKEAKKKNVKFVIFENAIDNRLRNSHSVMSYNDWFQELRDIKNLWI